ncbi:MAG: YncE family protein [Acidimicrobiales bacterium]
MPTVTTPGRRALARRRCTTVAAASLALTLSALAGSPAARAAESSHATASPAGAQSQVTVYPPQTLGVRGFAWALDPAASTVTPISLDGDALAGTTPTRAPYAVALDAATDTAYVANYSADTVTPISLKSMRAGKPIAVGKNPDGIAISPNHATAYVACYGSGSVVPITLATGKTRKPIRGGDGPSAIALSPSGTVAYVTDLISNKLAAISLSNGHALFEVHVGSKPDAVAVTPNGELAYVANFGSSSLTPVKLTTHSAAPALNVGSAPDGVTVTPDGTTALVVDYGSGQIVPITISSEHVGRAVWIGRDPSSVAVSPDGKTAYVTDLRAGTVVPVTLAPPAVGPVGQAVLVGAGAIAVAVSPDEGSLVVADYSGNALSLVDLGVVAARPAIHLAGEPQAAALTPDGTTLWVTLWVPRTSKGEILPITVATGVVGMAIPVGDEPDAIAIDAAGTEAVVANDLSGTASLVDLSNRTVTTVSVGSHPDAVAITPSDLAFVANYSSDDVTPIDLSSGEPDTPVTVAAGPDSLLVSPSGHFVLVASRGGSLVSKLEVDSLTVRQPAGVPSPMAEALGVDDLAYVVSQSGTLSSVALHDMTVTTICPSGTAPLGLAVSTTGPEPVVFVADSGSSTTVGAIAEINVTSGKTVLSVPIGSGVDAVLLTTVGPA